MFDKKKLKKMKEGIFRFDAVSETGFKKLADFGWYVDASLSLGYSTSLMEKAIKGDKNFLDNFFLNYYGNQISGEKRSFIKNSERVKIINEAIDCHNDSKYHASTILFLSQADGLCGGYLFKTGSKKKDLKNYLLNSDYGSLFLMLIKSIKQKSAIDSYYPNESVNFESELNRHGVIHGASINYGTEENSLKAFSLLCFVNDFVDRH